VLEVVPVTPERLNDVAALFSTSRVVTQCWCMWPRLVCGLFRPGDTANRDAMTRLIWSAEVPGVIALVEQRPVGWCAVGRRHDYPQYGEVSRDDDAWAVPCLFVAEAARGAGVGQALVKAALVHCRASGASKVHGPPPRWQPGGPDATAAAVAAFLNNGFERVADGARMPILEKTIRGDDTE